MLLTLLKKRKTRIGHVQRNMDSTQTSDSHKEVEPPESNLTKSVQDVQSRATANSPFQAKNPPSQTKKATPSRKSDTKPPSLKKDNSDLFKSFAKAKTKTKNVEQPASKSPSVAREPVCYLTMVT